MNLNAKGHTQEVTVAENWLTDGNGTFCKVACLPEGTNWAEVTNEAKEQWEAEHRPELVNEENDED